jgi:hypothetical protein
MSAGHEFMVRPLTTSASIRVHGPWQMTPAASKKRFTTCTAFEFVRSSFTVGSGSQEPFQATSSRAISLTP